MRDLSAFGDGAFDLVYHAHAINSIPDALTVFCEVARVLRPNGLYRVSCANPFIQGVWEDSWDGGGYRLRRHYVDGGEVTYDDPHWEFDSDDGTRKKVLGAREFRHSLSTLINGLIAQRLQILHIREWPTGDAGAEPGSFEHLAAHAPPWLTIWARLVDGGG
jgi:SAM-dependent methyltransferase